MNFLAIAPLTANLLSEAVALDQRCLGGLWTLEGYQRELDSPNSDLLVLQTAQKMIGLGCLWAILEEAHITLLAIDPGYQRQGLGQALLLALLVLARRRGLEWATLEVRTSNRAAIELYQKFGFQEVGRRRNYYSDAGQTIEAAGSKDALILWRKGLQQPDFEQILLEWQNQTSDRLKRSGWHFYDSTACGEKQAGQRDL